MSTLIEAATANGGDAVSAAAVPNTSLTVALFVGDLDFTVTDKELFDYFNADGHVVNVKVCKDINSRESLGYGYVNFIDKESAAKAIETLNYTSLNGKPIRIMYSNRDPSTRKNGIGNVFIKNIDKSVDNKTLLEAFTSFGNVLSCKVALDSFGLSKGYGFVQFENEEAALEAVEKLDGMLMNGKPVSVQPYVPKQERVSAFDKSKFTNVFVKNLSPSVTEDNLIEIFGEHGSTNSVVVMRDEEGKSKCFGFVNFNNADDAAKAVEALNGKTFDDKEWYVGKALKKYEREAELKGRFDPATKETDQTFGLNLYIKNLDDDITDDKLNELFLEFGTITSYKVMRNPNGVSRGTAFVAFSQADEASKAIAGMNGKIIGSKPLYVAFAQRKEDRRARLQAYFSQMRSGSFTPSFSPRFPIFPPGAPGMAQPVYFGQVPPAMIPQPGFGYQPQLIPGMRPGNAPMPNYFMPVPQGHQGPRPGGRRGGQHQSHQPGPMMQPQMFPMGRMMRIPPMRGMQETQLHGVQGNNMFAGSYDMNGFAPQEATVRQPMPVSALITALANAPPAQQINMLGENLYPLVQELEADAAGKVTGMLLEMDQTEVLHLIESPEALKAKVAEAMEVLRKSSRQQANTVDDQLSALSLKDNNHV